MEESILIQKQIEMSRIIELKTGFNIQQGLSTLYSRNIDFYKKCNGLMFVVETVSMELMSHFGYSDDETNKLSKKYINVYENRIFDKKTYNQERLKEDVSNVKNMILGWLSEFDCNKIETKG